MPRIPVHSDSAPKAIGPYSQAVRAGNTLYLSGQTPLDPAILAEIEPYLTTIFANPSSVEHEHGHMAAQAVERARHPAPRR